MNLLVETEEVLKEYGKTLKDVKWWGISGTFSEENIEELFNNVEYNNGFGRQNINDGLLIVGDEWWLERHEYDGSEWWEHKEIPVKPLISGKIKIISDE